MFSRMHLLPQQLEWNVVMELLLALSECLRFGEWLVLDKMWLSRLIGVVVNPPCKLEEAQRRLRNKVRVAYHCLETKNGVISVDALQAGVKRADLSGSRLPWEVTLQILIGSDVVIPISKEVSLDSCFYLIPSLLVMLEWITSFPCLTFLTFGRFRNISN